MHVVEHATVRVIGIVTEVLRESIGEHVLDGGHNRLEVILPRHEAVDVIALDVDDLVVAIVVGIELQAVEGQSFLVIVGIGKVIDLNVSRSVVQRIAPERSCGNGAEPSVGVLVGDTQAGKIQIVGLDVHVIV